MGETDRRLFAELTSRLLFPDIGLTCPRDAYVSAVSDARPENGCPEGLKRPCSPELAKRVEAATLCYA